MYEGVTLLFSSVSNILQYFWMVTSSRRDAHLFCLDLCVSNMRNPIISTQIYGVVFTFFFFKVQIPSAQFHRKRDFEKFPDVLFSLRSDLFLSVSYGSVAFGVLGTS